MYAVYYNLCVGKYAGPDQWQQCGFASCTLCRIARIEILTTMLLNVQIFWNVVTYVSEELKSMEARIFFEMMVSTPICTATCPRRLETLENVSKV